jgi:oligopeptide transport system ATP-binding protein
VEQGYALDLFSHPQHPYTQGLLKSVPAIGDRVKDPLVPIGGLPPDLLAPPQGCRFRARCPRRQAKCEETPLLRETAPNQWAACWFPGSAPDLARDATVATTAS